MINYKPKTIMLQKLLDHKHIVIEQIGFDFNVNAYAINIKGHEYEIYSTSPEHELPSVERNVYNNYNELHEAIQISILNELDNLFYKQSAKTE